MHGFVRNSVMSSSVMPSTSLLLIRDRWRSLPAATHNEERIAASTGRHGGKNHSEAAASSTTSPKAGEPPCRRALNRAGLPEPGRRRSAACRRQHRIANHYLRLLDSSDISVVIVCGCSRSRPL